MCQEKLYSNYIYIVYVYPIAMYGFKMQVSKFPKCNMQHKTFTPVSNAKPVLLS